MKKMFDVTRSISNDMLVYPGDIPVNINTLLALKEGDFSESTKLILSSHAGTHVDAPKHLFQEGLSVDKLSLDTLVGSARVIDLPQVKAIEKHHLDKLYLEGTARVLFKTNNSRMANKEEFDANYAHLTPGAAKYLVQCGCKLVGIDYLSVDPPVDELPVHHILLSAGVIIVEGLNLTEIQGGNYELICLPLKIAHCDGAPARVILRVED